MLPTMDSRAFRQTVYEQIGEEGIARLVEGFYRRVADDPVLRPMYPEDDLAPAARRLRMFLVQFFGGPDAYSQERGHPRLRLRHSPFTIDQTARDNPARVAIQGYFERTATHLINA